MQWVASQPAVSGFVASLVRDVHAREDILQETAQYLVAHASDFRGEGFTRWAIQIARYRVLEYRQRSVRHATVGFSESNIDALADAFVSLAPQRNDVREALEECLEKLSGRARHAIELRYWNELSADGIAGQTGQSVNAVYVTLHRARTALAECIERRLSSEGGAS